MAGAQEAIFGHSSAHSLATGPWMAEPFISPLPEPSMSRRVYVPGIGMAGPDKSPVRNMAVMTATERKLTRQIIEEKDERMKAMDDVWSKLEQLQAEVSDMRSTTAQSESRAQDSRRSSGAEQETFAMAGSLDVQAFRAELDNQRTTFNSRCTTLDRSVEDLRSSLGLVEMEAQQGISQNRAYTKALEDDLKALKETNRGQGSFMDKDPMEKAMTSHSPGSGGRTEEKLAHSGNSADARKSEEALNALKQQMSVIEEIQSHQVKELAAVRSVLIEVHVNLPLHAVRASRIALRSTELSREERKLALSSLETKEQHIRADIERVRERNAQSPLLALDDLRIMGLSSE